jgi:hypothetical protein
LSEVVRVCPGPYGCVRDLLSRLRRGRHGSAVGGDERRGKSTPTTGRRSRMIRLKRILATPERCSQWRPVECSQVLRRHSPTLRAG